MEFATVIENSQDADFFKDTELLEDYIVECPVKILTTTISNPMYCDAFFRIHKTDLLFYRKSIEKKTREIRMVHLFTIPYTNILSFIMNPDSHELILDLKPTRFSHSGWFTFRFLSADAYEDVIETLQGCEGIRGKHILWEYKTKAQDKRYGLLGSNEREQSCTRPVIVQKTVKGNQLSFRVYTSSGGF